jgi:hypothetical protein
VGLMTGAVAANLPNLEASLTRGKCTRFPTAGADQHYVGHWAVGEDGVITGTEKRVLFANPKWRQTRGPDRKMGADCVVVWDITGHKAAPITCTGCTFSVQFEARVNYDKSTCPKRLVNEGAYRTGQYDVSLKSDGTTAVYFSRTGKPFATGKHNTTSFNYMTAHGCVWF